MPFLPTTVEISNTNGLLSVRLLKGVGYYSDDEMFGFTHLNLNLASLPLLRNRNSVELYGETLLNALELHAAVRKELMQLSNFPAGTPFTLGFSIMASAAAQLRWEALCYHDRSFLAENGSCSLNRIAIGAAPQGTELRAYTSSIKLAAFLSPSSVSSEEEFNAISEAVVSAGKTGLIIEAVIYVGEQSLLDKELERIAVGDLQGITVKPMPANALAIEAALKNDKAQILHFFCHGHSLEGVQLLEFASISDHDIEAAKGSVTFSIERLQECLASTGTTWLTVLNSCSGANDVPNLFSMAATLAKSVSPIAIGMAEPIMNIDATVFARSFYPKALQIIYECLNDLALNCATTIDLGPAVSHARRALFDTAEAAEQNEPDSFSRWCLPVYYVRDPALRVMHIADTNMKGRIETVALALQGLPPSTPIELRDQILKVLANPPAIDPTLWPDRFGNLV